MRSKENNFDSVAPFYDLLVKLVFGNAMKKAQTCFFDQLPFNGQVLILGGGTGWIIEELLKVRPAFHITYIEASATMISIARKRFEKSSKQVTLIHATEQGIPNLYYDVVITNFFLDLFPDQELPQVLSSIKRSLTERPYWIVTDFVERKWWHRAMLRIMYQFFRVTSNIRAKRLPQWHQAMQTAGMRETNSKNFYGAFIESKLYRLSE